MPVIIGIIVILILAIILLVALAALVAAMFAGCGGVIALVGVAISAYCAIGVACELIEAFWKQLVMPGCAYLQSCVSKAWVASHRKFIEKNEARKARARVENLPPKQPKQPYIWK